VNADLTHLFIINKLELEEPEVENSI